VQLKDRATMRKFTLELHPGWNKLFLYFKIGLVVFGCSAGQPHRAAAEENNKNRIKLISLFQNRNVRITQIQIQIHLD